MGMPSTIQTVQSQAIQVYREMHTKPEARLYCYSEKRAAKEEAILE
jgi:hypothetical protein